MLRSRKGRGRSTSLEEEMTKMVFLQGAEFPAQFDC